MPTLVFLKLVFVLPFALIVFVVFVSVSPQPRRKQKTRFKTIRRTAATGDEEKEKKENRPDQLAKRDKVVR